MGVDIGGPSLEVAIGLAFVFFLLSLIVSACTEAFSWARSLRAKTLAQGLHGMLGDQRIANELMQHPLVQTDLTQSRGKKKPSYLSRRNFALALSDIVSDLGKDTSLKNLKDGIDKIGKGSALGRQLTALLSEGEGDMESFLGAAEKWFDDSMDRVSGWYKRKAQLISIVLAVIVAVGLNADAIRLAERLANEPTVRATVVSQAEAAAQKPCCPGKTGEEKAGEEAVKTPMEAAEDVQSTVKELDSLKLPLLWGDGNDDLRWSMLVGWLITAIAVSLGAPFWFDALGKLAHLRTTGKKPDPDK